jgi:hypothetical protein
MKIFFEVHEPTCDGLPITQRSHQACIDAGVLVTEMISEGRKAINAGRSSAGEKHIKRADQIKEMENLFLACLFSLEQCQAAHKTNVSIIRAAHARIQELEKIIHESKSF